MTILTCYCILHSLCKTKAFQQAQNTATIYLLPNKTKRLINIENKRVSFCIKLYTMNFCNIKKKLKSRIRRYLQTMSSLPQVSPLLLGVHSRGGKPCPINILFLTPLATTDIVHETQTFCMKHGKATRSVTFCNRSLWGALLP